MLAESEDDSCSLAAELSSDIKVDHLLVQTGNRRGQPLISTDLRIENRCRRRGVGLGSVRAIMGSAAVELQCGRKVSRLPDVVDLHDVDHSPICNGELNLSSAQFSQEEGKVESPKIETSEIASFEAAGKPRGDLFEGRTFCYIVVGNPMNCGGRVGDVDAWVDQTAEAYRTGIRAAGQDGHFNDAVALGVVPVVSRSMTAKGRLKTRLRNGLFMVEHLRNQVHLTLLRAIGRNETGSPRHAQGLEEEGPSQWRRPSSKATAGLAKRWRGPPGLFIASVAILTESFQTGRSKP